VWDFELGLMSAGRGLGFLQEKGLRGRESVGKLRVGDGGVFGRSTSVFPPENRARKRGVWSGD